VKAVLTLNSYPRTLALAPNRTPKTVPQASTIRINHASSNIEPLVNLYCQNKRHFLNNIYRFVFFY
jgi:hypothetical protein